MLKQETAFKTQQRLSQEMHQALHILQMPVLQLRSWLELQVQQNPLLEIERDGEDVFSHDPQPDCVPEIDFTKSDFEVLKDLDDSFEHELFSENKNDAGQDGRHGARTEEFSTSYPSSLFDHLMSQAKESFSSLQDLHLAEILIGNLDENGFLPSELTDIVSNITEEKCKAVLQKIQLFDPPGIAAQSMRESLLMQLKHRGKETSLAHQIISDHFEVLCLNQFSLLEKRLKISLQEIEKTIQQDIRPLSLSPGRAFCYQPTSYLVPDVIIEQEDTGWKIGINSHFLPSIQVAEIPETLSDIEKRVLLPYLFSAKNLLRAVEQRHKTLSSITTYLVQKQQAFFDGSAQAVATLTLQQVAYALDLHPSTIHRAMHEKIISCPQGLLPMRHFICQPLAKHAPDSHSTDQVKKILLELLKNEDKRHPLSDQALSNLIQKQGIRCARRTITKYRTNLHIPTASQRKQWISAP